MLNRWHRLGTTALLGVFALAGARTALAGNCPDGTTQIGENRTETADTITIQPVCKRVPRAPTPEECQTAERQAGADRELIHRNQKALQDGQDELADWSARGEDAQVGMIMDSVTLLLGEYASNLGEMQDSVAALEGRVANLAADTKRAQTNARRLKALSRLDKALAELRPLQSPLLAKEAAEHATSAIEGWNVARDTMHNEFRVAAKHNAKIREALQDPEFRKALSGDDLDQPAQQVLATLSDEALEHADKLDASLMQYELITGPTVRVAAFVRDMAYDSLLMYSSVSRVNQQSDLAGKFAEAAGVLQEQYKKTVNTLRQCHRQT